MWLPERKLTEVILKPNILTIQTVWKRSYCNFSSKEIFMPLMTAGDSLTSYKAIWGFPHQTLTLWMGTAFQWILDNMFIISPCSCADIRPDCKGKGWFNSGQSTLDRQLCRYTLVGNTHAFSLSILSGCPTLRTFVQAVNELAWYSGSSIRP